MNLHSADCRIALTGKRTEGCPRCAQFTAPSFRNADDAFADAIAAGRLSSDPASSVYAGDYMYMGTRDGRDLFKHSDSREYLR